MVYGKFKLSSVILLSVILVCIEFLLWKLGKSIYCYFFKSGIDLEVVIGNVLILMYVKCGLFI